MPTSPLSENIEAYHRLAKHSFHRRLVTLSGTKDWCLSVIANFVSKQEHSDCLLISSSQPAIGLSQLDNCVFLSSEKLSTKLGSECDHLIWDGFSGLNPDGLGIASGLLKGGGLFFLLLPELSDLDNHDDPDYARMCSSPEQLSRCRRLFLKRLAKHLAEDPQVYLIEQKNPPQAFQQEAQPETHNIVTLDQATPNYATADQERAILAIKKAAFGHRHRPVVIEANRGRGKSSALGLAAAQLVIEKQASVIITAPSKNTCQAAFDLYRREIQHHYRSPEQVEEALSSFKFFALDALLSERPSCHILFIDEAAAIPSATLKLLLEAYPRIVFSTTIHGYEGNGRGFSVRFKQTLNNLRPNWHKVTLTQAVRWRDNDPLEHWFFKFLLLDAELEHNSENQHAMRLEQVQDFSSNCSLVEPSVLFSNETLLRQIVSLLVTAHYQTTPSDIRMILDHPSVNILINHANTGKSITPSSVLGVSLLLEEGGINSDTLAEQIISGLRRPRGQLFPQALCATSANPTFLKQKTLRVMRIAVHPDYQSVGIGSQLLSAVAKFAGEHDIDSVSTSYGLSPELLAFWHKNLFSAVKLGTRIDGASGLQSVMMMRPVSEPAKQLFNERIDDFFHDFVFQLTRQHQTLSSQIVMQMLQDQAWGKLSLRPLDKQLLNQVHAYGYGQRPYEETALTLFYYILEKIKQSAWQQLGEEWQHLLVVKVLQDREHAFCLKHFNLTGKKHLEKALRGAISILLDAET